MIKEMLLQNGCNLENPKKRTITGLIQEISDRLSIVRADDNFSEIDSRTLKQTQEIMQLAEKLNAKIYKQVKVREQN